MRILSAIFPYAGHIPFDISRIQGRVVEGGIKKLDQSRIFPDQAAISFLHGQF